MAVFIDTETLLMEIERRPPLWDYTNENYKNKELKTLLWLEVAEVAVKGFDKLRTTEGDDKLLEKVQGRWKSARDSYVREYKKLKTVDNSKRRKEYLYFSQMKFLDKLGVPTMRTEPNFEPVLFDYENSLESDDQNLQIKKERRYNKRNEIGVEADDCMSVTNREQEEQNDDQQFLNSLIPTLKLFTNDQKLIFRCEALKLLMNVKNNFTLVPTVHTTSTYSLSSIPQNIPPNHYQIVPPQSSSPVEDKNY